MNDVTLVGELLQYKDYIFAALFVFLLLYVLKTNDTREKNYQSIIQELTEHIGIIKTVSEKVDRIEVTLEKIDGRSK